MENIIACVRIKPVSKEEEVCFNPASNQVITNAIEKEKYEFEHIFDQSTSTEKIFDIAGSSLIDSFLKGMNVCIFAYGQTSSGKTHTMKGEPNSPGLIPLSLIKIFRHLEENKEFDYLLKFSYVEIYLENVIDLFDGNNKNLEIRENIQKGIHIPGLTEIAVSSHEEAMQLFEKGDLNRKKGETQLNPFSSRSHSIFQVHLQVRHKNLPGKTILSSLNMIDLAGSEGANKARTEGLRMKEGANINKSLLALTSVISKLANQDGVHINYRDSKLTRYLQPFLGGKLDCIRYIEGNSKTMVICTLNPTMQNYQESLSTIKFAKNAGTIKNTVKVNEISEFEYSNKKENERKDVLLAEYENENNFLREELLQYRIDAETKIQNLESLLSDANDKIKELSDQNANMINELKSERSRIETIESDYDRSKGENADLIRILNEIEEKYKNFEKERNMLASIREDFDRRLAEVRSDNKSLMDKNNLLVREIEDLNKRNYYAIIDFNKQLTSIQEQNTQLKKKLQELIEENHKLMKNSQEEKQGTTSVPKTFDFRSINNLDEDQELRLLELESKI